MTPDLTPVEALRMRYKRKRLLWRSFRARHALRVVQDRTNRIGRNDILLFACMRNESERIDHFLAHYRSLGVTHFLIVDNDSDDGTRERLVGAGDVSLWHTQASYRRARFGLDWITWLQIKHGHGHWCVTVDADELLDYDGRTQLPLPALTKRLEALGQTVFGALMLDLVPEGRIGQAPATPVTDPLQILKGFEAGPFRAARQRPMLNLWVQGGLREQAFFAQTPERSPTLNKLPLVKWNRRYCYVNSTHSILPPRLNLGYDGPGDPRPNGVLLHTKFLPTIVSKSETERVRAEHFTNPQKFGDYYEQLAQAPVLWGPQTLTYQGTEQLKKLGLIAALTEPTSLN